MANIQRLIDAQVEKNNANKPKTEVVKTTSRLPVSSPTDSLQRIKTNPDSLSPADLFQLQRTLGNRAVGALLGRSTSRQPVIQAKLMVNAPGDIYEQEADRVAEQVMQMPMVQEEKPNEEGKPAIMTLPDIHRDGDGAFEVDEDFERQLGASRGQGEPLPVGLREEFETKFGMDFSGVRIHTDTQSDVLNQSIQAKAFTTGQDIFFKQNEYQPDSLSGKRLLAHELTHTLQQMSKAQSDVPYLKRAIQRVLDDKQYKIAKEKGGYKGLKGSKLIGVAALMRKYNEYLRKKDWLIARAALAGLKSALKSEHKQIRPKLPESRQGYFDYFIQGWLDEVKKEKANLKDAGKREKAAEEAYGSYQEQKDKEAVLELLNAIAGNILESMQEKEGLLRAHVRDENTIDVLKLITSVVENINASMKTIQNDDTRSDFFKTYYQKKATELLNKLKYYHGLFNMTGLADYRRG